MPSVTSAVEDHRRQRDRSEGQAEADQINYEADHSAEAKIEMHSIYKGRNLNNAYRDVGQINKSPILSLCPQQIALFSGRKIAMACTILVRMDGANTSGQLQART